MRKVIPVLFLVVLGTALAVVVGCGKDEDPVTPPAPCTAVTVNSPQPGASIIAGDPDTPGESVTIRWSITGGAPPWNISLLKGGTDTTRIASGVTVNLVYGYYSYPWNASTYGSPSGADYRILVEGIDQEACRGVSSNFELINLAGCETYFPYQTGKDTIPDLTADEVFTIRWTTVRSSDTVRLELWTTSPGPAFTPKEAFPIDIAAPNVPSSGDTVFYDWTVSSFNHSESAIYRFRVTDANLNTCGDTSIPFRITDYSVCSISVGIPAETTVYDPGEVVRIDVVGINLPGLPGLVDAELLAEGGQVPGTIVEDHDPSQPILWPADDFGFTGVNSYRVRVISAEDPYCTGVSIPIQITR